MDHAQILGALGNLNLHERLDRADVGHRVEVVREVVHPLDDRDHLPVGLVLGGLLDSRVDIADDRFDVAHDLGLEGDEQPQDAMRGGVVGAEVERHQLVCRLSPAELLIDGGERDALLAPAVLGQAGALGWGLAHSRDSSHLASSCVKMTGSPPIGKSRRWGWPS